MTTDRLTSIANRQRGTRVRDAVFAACLGLGIFLQAASLTTAADAATPSSVVAPR